MRSDVQEIAREIISLLRDEAMTRFPAFGEAFGRLRPVPLPGAAAPGQSASPRDIDVQTAHLPANALSAPLATDGEHLFYDPEAVCLLFKMNADGLRYLFLHTHLHCLCLHIISEPFYTISRCSVPAPGFYTPQAHSLLPDSCAPQTHSLSDFTPWDIQCDQEADALAARLLPPHKCFPRLRDSHQFWPGRLISDSGCGPRASAAETAGHLSASELSTLEHLHQLWENSSNVFRDSADPAKSSGKRGHSPGRSSEEADLKAASSTDYRHFLRRFTVPREETLLDVETFDYIPYYWGLTHYDGIPFIEPLEYREVNRLDELAIAIDTSGSCSGRIVRRFLEETWSLLRQRENFFSHMRLHLIQCDSIIQEHRIFTSVEEWEASIRDLKILGHGDTDFCPVFKLLDDLIAQKEIRHLRGLLYFTDGDGIYPTTPPAYDTAFVFLNHELEKHEIPRWGIRLNLNLPDI